MQSIEFQILHKVEFGQAIYFANSEFNWQIDKISRMQCIDQNIWSIQILLSSDILEYKYAIGEYDNVNPSDLCWERGTNRIFKKNPSKQNRIIRDQWERKKVVIKLAVGKYRGTCYFVGKFNNNILLQNMKLIYRKNNYYFKTRIYVDKNNETSVVQIQYYLLLYYENCTLELISKPIYVDNILECKDFISPLSLNSCYVNY